MYKASSKNSQLKPREFQQINNVLLRYPGSIISSTVKSNLKVQVSPIYSSSKKVRYALDMVFATNCFVCLEFKSKPRNAQDFLYLLVHTT
jgi:hypothetical protein